MSKNNYSLAQTKISTRLKTLISYTTIAVALLLQPIFGVGALWTPKTQAETIPANSTSTCSKTNAIYSTTLTNWDLSQTKSTGHNQITAEGLHIWTEGKTPSDKAAGYYAVDYPLSLGTEPTMTLVKSADGGIPGMQLIVDFNNDTTLDGILVGEPSVYGDDWWLSNSSSNFVKQDAPEKGGGPGSAFHGTLAQWRQAFPDARVQHVGYSLGSGVKGDVTVRNFTFGCTTYIFGLDTTAPSIKNIEVSPLIAGNLGSTVRISFDLTDQSGIDFSQTKVLFADGPGDLNRARESAKYTPILMSGNRYYVEIDTKLFLKQNYVGTYTLQFNLRDSLGNNTSTKPAAFRAILIDNSGPASTMTTASGQSVNKTTRIDFTITDDTDVQGGYAKFVSPTVTRDLPLIRDSGSTWYVIADLPDESYRIDVRPVDSFGTPRYRSSAGTITFDRLAPLPPSSFRFSTPAGALMAHTGYTNSYQVKALWNAVDDATTYQYAYWNDIATSPYRSLETAWKPLVAGTSYSGVFNQGEGRHYGAVRAIDAAGNVSDWSNIFQITYDGTMPEASIESINGEPLGSVLSSLPENTIRVTGTFTDNLHANNLQVQLVKDGTSQGLTITHGIQPSGSLLAEFDASSLEDGDYTITLTPTDMAGNVPAAKIYTFTLDNTAPRVEFVTPVGSIQEALGISVEFSDPNLSRVAFEVRGPNGFILNTSPLAPTGNTVLTNYDLCLNDRLKKCVLNDLEDGRYTVRAFAYDSAGNRNITSSHIITLDQTMEQSNSNPPLPDDTPADTQSVLGDSTPTPNRAPGLIDGSSAVIQRNALAVASGSRTSAAQIEDAAVLAASDTMAQIDSESVELDTASDVLVQTDSCTKFMGVCWYWWLIAVPVIVILVWLIRKATKDGI